MSTEESTPPRSIYDELIHARSLRMDAARESRLERQRKLGKMTLRERVDLLFDERSFRERGMLVLPSDVSQEAIGKGDSDELRVIGAADGLITGTGLIDGRPVSFAGFDFTVFGGSNGDIQAQKYIRLGNLALQHGHPLVNIYDGAGHRVQEGLEAWTFVESPEPQAIMNRMSGWAPMAAAILGPVFGGTANWAAIADFVVMAEGIGSAGLAGPMLVKAATGEDISKEDLGGPKMQAGETGLVDLVTEDEPSAIEAIRRFLSYLPSNAGLAPPYDPDWSEPEGDPIELRDLVPQNLRQAYDVRKVIEHVVDAGSLFELRPTFGRNAITGLARIAGKAVGVIANQPAYLAGTLDAKACDKLSRFVGICDAYGLPIVSFIDVPGFFIGTQAERSGITRKGSRLVFDMNHRTVPLVSVCLRKGFGLGYCGMGGSQLVRPTLNVAWPGAQIAGMSVEGAVDTVYRPDPSLSEEQAADYRAEKIEELGRRTGPIPAAEKFALDDVILPEETRDVILHALAAYPGRPQPVSSPRRVIPPA